MPYISQFPELTQLGIQGNDLVDVVDVSVGVNSGANKKIQYQAFFQGIPRGTGIAFAGSGERIVSSAVGVVDIQVGFNTVAFFTQDGINSTWVGNVIQPQYGGTGFTSLSGLAAAIGYGENWTGNPIPIAKGGTDATNPTTARENLGLKSGLNDLASLANVSSSGVVVKRSGSGGYTTTSITGTNGQIQVLNPFGTNVPNEKIEIGLVATGVVSGTYGSPTANVVVEFDAFGRAVSVEEVPIDTLPSGGSIGQVLTVTGTSPRLAGWTTILGLLPAGGSTGQVLKKISTADYAVAWQDETGGGGTSSGTGGDTSAGGLAYLFGVTV